ncbi:hypothetical protein LARV_01449 [Longilinea arvoryzae]|uniref:SCP2 domain-containing protein n=1 Tax=Longilinea arvoryzae TaxID=360412 RepID=A0A0S7B8V4_9CHLR|nr:hypothetical protein [Longilinea arvoryzae]GAP13694.1 hypothetical protein LARV_01449 [Longilinea arvoryzae]
MDAHNFPDIPPRRKPFKRAINQIVLFVLGRALQSLSHSDPLVQQEVSTWPENLTLMMVIRPDGGSLAVTRGEGGRLIYRGSRVPEAQADVVIYIKNVDGAFAMFTGQQGIDVAYAQHAMCARGDLSNTVSVVRVLNIAESYLFPAFLARRLMKELPPIPLLRKHGLRIKTYTLGLLFGL